MGYYLGIPVIPSDSEPDWAVVWTMRWTAITAAFTGLSWLAIAATALYAQHAISVNIGIERAKLSRELIKEYQSRKIDDVRVRCTRSPMPPEYSDTSFLADLDAVLLYFEECAIHYESRTIDRELLLSFLDVKTVATWQSLSTVAFPRLNELSHLASGRFQRIQHFAQQAQLHLRRRRDIPRSSTLLEPLA